MCVKVCVCLCVLTHVCAHTCLCRLEDDGYLCPLTFYTIHPRQGLSVNLEFRLSVSKPNDVFVSFSGSWGFRTTWPRSAFHLDAGCCRFQFGFSYLCSKSHLSVKKIVSLLKTSGIDATLVFRVSAAEKALRAPFQCYRALHSLKGQKWGRHWALDAHKGHYKALLDRAQFQPLHVPHVMCLYWSSFLPETHTL